MYEKLKSLRERLRCWNRKVFGWINLKVEVEAEKINDLDKLMMENIEGDIDPLVHDRREVSKELWNCLIIKESMLRQKSCNLWLEEGDKNSRFFHNAIKDRQRRNAITRLEGEDGRVEGVANIKEEVERYFHNFFKEEDYSRPVPEGLDFNCLTEDDVVWLERLFTEEEVKEVVWSCDGNKSLGSDDFSLEFFMLI